MTADDRESGGPEPHGALDAGALHGWRSPPVIGVTLVLMAAGFGQFGAVAALGDVAEGFGEATDGTSIADRAGLSGTVLGLGLTAIRLAALLSLPLASIADRVGRRRTLLAFSTLGLALVVVAAASPTYWWFVALFALSRPLLTAADTVGEVAAAEETGTRDRTKAMALVAAGYGVGSGLVAVTRGVASDTLGFRGVFALAVVPLVLVAVASRWVSEPRRYDVAGDRPLPVLGPVGRRHRRRLIVLLAITFAIAGVTGPANSFLFVYAENVLELPASATAAMVVGAGATGLLGLLAGRWAADSIGRRPTAGIAMAGVAAAGMAMYSGSVVLLVAGYLLGVAMGSAFAPAMGALSAELFPTEVRAAVSGWMVAAGVLGASTGLLSFGVLADAGDRFFLPAIVVFAGAAVVAPLLAAVPETRGRELEAWHEE